MLKLEGVSKAYTEAGAKGGSRVPAVIDLSLTVEEGHFFTLLGPSGCGKTTTLRCIAGLETPDGGTISVADRVLYSSRDGISVPPNRRGLGMVFQSYAIWPHMDVFENVAFPLREGPARRSLTPSQVRDRVEHVLSVVHLDGYIHRRATDLSGGQQQRLALARAIVMEPPVLLLDEPLSNLDAMLRDEMRIELRRLQQDLGITSVYVTHDQSEALSMSTMIAVMNNGVVEQVGTPKEVYEGAQTKFVASFVGTTNMIRARVEKQLDSEHWDVSTDAGAIAARALTQVAIGDAGSVSVRPGRIAIEPLAGDAAANDQWIGTVVTSVFLGDAVEYLVAVSGLELRVHQVGTDVIDAGAVVRLRPSTGHVRFYADS